MRTLLAKLLPLALLLGVGSVGAATLSVSPTSVPVTGSVTATWSGIATPSGTDWIGLYTPGAANTSYLSWRYTTGTASGSVPFTIPAASAPGTYQLRIFVSNGYSATSNNFTVSAKLSGTVTVSGAPLSGVSFAATNGGTCDSSNAVGQYSCSVPPGWSGSITPSLSGYAFTPASRSYSNVTAAQAGQNFTVTPTYQLSGTVTAGGSALSEVTLAATNGGTCTSSNASGQYSCTVPHGWSGTVTPSRAGYAFTPASRTYSAVAGALAAQDYAASVTYQLSGTVTQGGSPLSGVVFLATDGGNCTTSNASGQYSCTVAQGWSGSVTAWLDAYIFSPESRSYANVTANQTAQDYVSTAVHKLSGTISMNGVPLSNVTLAAPGGVCTSSNASGQYSCNVPPGWSGSVTPSANGYTFTPASRSYTSVAGNQTAQDYSGTLVSATAPMFFVHVDHLNTPRLVANAAGTTVWRWDQQEPFGINVPDENPSALGAFEFPLRFPGQYFDKETNLHYNNFRDFDPSLGRYAESDLLGLDGGFNTYGYALFSPLLFADPAGLSPNPGKFPLRLPSGWAARIDAVPGTDLFEIHVCNAAGNEVGLFGAKGWFNKHGHKGAPAGLPADVDNALKGIVINELRKRGKIPPKGKADIKGKNWVQKVGKACAGKCGPVGSAIVIIGGLAGGDSPTEIAEDAVCNFIFGCSDAY